MRRGERVPAVPGCGGRWLWRRPRGFDLRERLAGQTFEGGQAQQGARGIGSWTGTGSMPPTNEHHRSRDQSTNHKPARQLGVT